MAEQIICVTATVGIDQHLGSPRLNVLKRQLLKEAWGHERVTHVDWIKDSPQGARAKLTVELPVRADWKDLTIDQIAEKIKANSPTNCELHHICFKETE